MNMETENITLDYWEISRLINGCIFKFYNKTEKLKEIIEECPDPFGDSPNPLGVGFKGSASIYQLSKIFDMDRQDLVKLLYPNMLFSPAQSDWILSRIAYGNVTNDKNTNYKFADSADIFNKKEITITVKLEDLENAIVLKAELCNKENLNEIELRYKEKLSVEQAAEFIHISPTILKAWVNSGLVPFVEENGERFFKSSDIVKIIIMMKVLTNNLSLYTEKIKDTINDIEEVL